MTFGLFTDKFGIITLTIIEFDTEILGLNIYIPLRDTCKTNIFLSFSVFSNSSDGSVISTKVLHLDFF